MRRVYRRLFVAASALVLLTVETSADGLEQPKAEWQGPWLTTLRGTAEYFAINPSIENREFWMGFSCLGDKHVYLSFLQNDIPFPETNDRPFSVSLKFDGGASIMMDAKYVNSHMVTVSPQSSEDMLILTIHSHRIEASISPNWGSGAARSFNVQPYAPGLSNIIRTCSVDVVPAPEESL